ncbi:protein-L-isoaspartate O-methyltransferase family protein [Aestuariivirga sp.]|uniref:protein-L-isoaspartate O-methyltransferase family protein n=1 Tax=Aestuariivirga sp. TaxID=2650926 RepID=UPI00391A4B20
MTDFTAARLNMIESQVRPNGITDRRIIAAMERVPREAFVPESRRVVAYMDEDVPLQPSDAAVGRRALIEAMAFARMLQHAAIRPSDKVLLVGAGTGYGAAVVSAIAGQVFALECDPGLAAEARRNLEGLANVTVKEGALPGGLPDSQPFDVIVIEGRVEEVPQALLDQLADGGRLVAAVGEADMAQACVYTKSGAAIATRQVFDASVTALPGFRKKKPAFMF